MKALITGVNGFVGGYLTEHLISKGIEVWGTKLKNESIDEEFLTKITLRDMDLIEKEQVYAVIDECKPDFVFHLAAQSSVALSWKLPQLTMNVNIIGTLNLLDALRQECIETKILMIGSSEEYGKIQINDIPVGEDHKIEPANPYAISKMAQEMMAMQYVSAYNMKIILVRAFNHIGPKQATIFVLPDFANRIVKIEKGYMKPILMVGNLEAKRDFTDVRDIVDAYYKLISIGKSGEIYNVGSGNCYSIKYILDNLLKQTTVNIEVQEDPDRMRPSDIPIIQCDNRKIKMATDWEPQYKIEDTIKDVLNYWRNVI